MEDNTGDSAKRLLARSEEIDATGDAMPLLYKCGVIRVRANAIIYRSNKGVTAVREIEGRIKGEIGGSSMNTLRTDLRAATGAP